MYVSVGNMNKVKWEKSHPEFFYYISYILKNQTKPNKSTFYVMIKIEKANNVKII